MARPWPANTIPASWRRRCWSGATPSPWCAPVRATTTCWRGSGARHGWTDPRSPRADRRRGSRRGSHPPGTFWYYNNWDFNVLGEAYQRLTGHSVFQAFEHQLARPLGFEDFDPMRHARFDFDREAPRFPAYDLWLSARDMAKFG